MKKKNEEKKNRKFSLRKTFKLTLVGLLIVCLISGISSCTGFIGSLPKINLPSSWFTWFDDMPDWWPFQKVTNKEPANDKADNVIEFPDIDNDDIDYSIYHVTFVANGGVLEGQTVFRLDHDGYLTAYPSDPTKEHADFIGWYTYDINADNYVQVSLMSAFHGDYTLIAYWGDIQPITITFDPKGGTLMTNINTFDSYSGRVDYFPMAKRNGYALMGWYLDQEGQRAVSSDMIFTENITLYAYWRSIQSYTIEFVQLLYENGHITNNTHCYDVYTMYTDSNGYLASVYSPKEFVGVYFAGWALEANSTSYVNPYGQFNSNARLYSIYKPTGRFIISYKVPDLDNPDSEGYYTYNDYMSDSTQSDGKVKTMPTLQDNEELGLGFRGWSLLQRSKYLIDVNYVFKGDTTLYAWYDKGGTDGSGDGQGGNGGNGDSDQGNTPGGENQGGSTGGGSNTSGGENQGGSTSGGSDSSGGENQGGSTGGGSNTSGGENQSGSTSGGSNTPGGENQGGQGGSGTGQGGDPFEDSENRSPNDYILDFELIGGGYDVQNEHEDSGYDDTNSYHVYFIFENTYLKENFNGHVTMTCYMDRGNSLLVKFEIDEPSDDEEYGIYKIGASLIYQNQSYYLEYQHEYNWNDYGLENADIIIKLDSNYGNKFDEGDGSIVLKLYATPLTDLSNKVSSTDQNGTHNSTALRLALTRNKLAPVQIVKFTERNTMIVYIHVADERQYNRYVTAIKVNGIKLYGYDKERANGGFYEIPMMKLSSVKIDVTLSSSVPTVNKAK